MKKNIRRFFFLYIIICNIGCNAGVKIVEYQEKKENPLTIREYIVSTTAQIVNYKSRDDKHAIIELSSPVKVAQANQEESWGYYQFPKIGKADDGTLIVTWSMSEDSHKSYGKESERRIVPMMSKDGGITWTPQDKKYRLKYSGYNVYLSNGEELHVTTPASKNINQYKNFPEAVQKRGNYAYYPIEALPEDLQGIYFEHVKDKKTKVVRSKLVDPGLLRNTIDGMMPVVWWGSIKQLADKSLVAGIYPARYINDDGVTVNSGVAFYKSLDEGKKWIVLGKIPYHEDSITIKGEGEFTEPDFEILADSTFLCVMRSGSMLPMYKAYSYDGGKRWTVPKPFTPNGVLPRLFLLKNGVLVLISGRPGMQVRFSLDGTGNNWTDPIDMIPYMESPNTIKQNVSCGYGSYVVDGDNSFYIVYSDFTTKDHLGRHRKSIWCRKITVNPKRY